MKFFLPKHSLCGEVWALHRGVFASIAIDKEKKWISIYSIESTKPDKGNAQLFVKKLKELMPKTFTLFSSVPLNPTWQHICDKYGVKYPKDI